MTDLWWQRPGIAPLPVAVRFEPPAGSLRAQHGAALRASLQDRVDVKAETGDEEQEGRS